MSNDKEKHHHHGDHELPLVINGKCHVWPERYITGSEIRKLGEIPPDHEIHLGLKRPYDDQLVTDESRQDLALPGLDHFYSKKPGEHHLVKIFINRKEYPIQRGKHTVSALKTLGKVPLDYELQEMIDGKLTPLPDNGTVLIKGCEEFFSTVKGGGSS
jgi:hypothetical protein